MRVTAGDFGTAIYLTGEEVKRLCKPGQGADTCIWLMVGKDGFECGYHNRHPSLVERWQKGLTVAKRDGCDEIRFLSVELVINPKKINGS